MSEILILYIDHSVVSHEPSWAPLGEVLASSKLRLALSLWNLVEIANAADQAQRERRLSFLERFKPLWIVERVEVQRQEVRSFLWQQKFGVVPAEVCVVTPHLSVVDSYHTGSRARVGLTARTWIDGIDLSSLGKLKHLAPAALSSLQTIDKKAFGERQHEIFGAWIKGLIPAIDPEGKALSVAQRIDLLNFCEKHQDQFLAACKSLAVEDALTTARISDLNRKPKPTDGIDLMHSVIALAYCDIFLVRDRFVRFCCEHATRSLRTTKLAQIYFSPSQLRDEVFCKA